MGTRLTALGRFSGLSTLREVVDEYVRVLMPTSAIFENGHHDPVLSWTIRSASLEEAIERACAGRREDGRMFSKGSCVRTVARRELASRLSRPIDLEMIGRATSFDQVYDVVRSARPRGIGDMMTYNVAERVAAWMGFYPEEHLYLHAGPAIGWRRLVGRRNGEDHRVRWTDVPREISSRLSPHQAEDFLCEMRDVLHRGLSIEEG